MRESAQKLFQGNFLTFIYILVIHSKYDDYYTFITAIDNSGWLKHIKAILDSTIFVTQVFYYIIFKIYRVF